MRTRSLAPLAALAVAGCMASKSDIALLQTDLQTMRTESARGDRERQAQIKQVLASICSTSSSTCEEKRTAWPRRFAASTWSSRCSRR